MNLDDTLMDDSDILLHLEPSDIIGDHDHDLGSMDDFGGAFESFFGLDGKDAAMPDSIFSHTTNTAVQPDRVASATTDAAMQHDNGMDRIQRQLEVINQSLDAIPVVDQQAKAMARWQRVQHMRGRSQVDLHAVSGLVPAVTKLELTEITTQLLQNNCQDVNKFVQTALPPVAVQSAPSSTQRRSNRTVVPTAKAQENAVPDMVSSGTGPANKRKALKKKRESSVKTSLPPVYTATQQHVELPSGSDAESKRQRRLIRNRLSAALHRERKREVGSHQAFF